MKNKIILLLVLLIPSLCIGEKYTSLKNNDYKNLRLVIEGVNENHSGLTKQDILNEIKLLCLQSGIKASAEGSEDFLYINVSILKTENTDVFNINIQYIKFSPPLAEWRLQTGISYAPDQGFYSALGIGVSKEFILGFLRSEIKQFLVDYLESNIE